ncbi:uncharacterized protein LOC108669231 [Hyalella azteca]|uniref:Uncharacterized protein LOC108669231 n=1 Tax=Hyalella azteca TaxID=294128 RepID=A0A8B7NEJ0_HYAAZ|nr:uncharacterized protein LOC108669231 [Hyalella azteca]
MEKLIISILAVQLCTTSFLSLARPIRTVPHNSPSLSSTNVAMNLPSVESDDVKVSFDALEATGTSKDTIRYEPSWDGSDAASKAVADIESALSEAGDSSSLLEEGTSAGGGGGSLLPEHSYPSLVREERIVEVEEPHGLLSTLAYYQDNVEPDVYDSVSDAETKLPSTRGSFRQWNYFTDLLIRTMLESEDNVKESIKCILRLPCNLPRTFRTLLEAEGMNVLLYGKCSPGTCSEQTEETANIFRHVVEEKHPLLYAETVTFLKEIEKLGGIEAFLQKNGMTAV